MSHLNLDDYYSKISQIRTRILSQHQPTLPPRPALAPKPQEIYQAADYAIPGPTPQDRLPPYLRGHSQPKAPIPHPAAVPSSIPATASNKASVVEDRVDVNARLKELESVNEKIKHMLAGKRSSVVLGGESKVSAKVETPAAAVALSRWEKPHESAIEGKWERTEENKRVGALFGEEKKSFHQETPIVTPISSHYTPPPPSTFAHKLGQGEVSKEALEKSRRNTSREVERLEQIAQSRKRVKEEIE